MRSYVEEEQEENEQLMLLRPSISHNYTINITRANVPKLLTDPSRTIHRGIQEKKYGIRSIIR